MHNYLLSNISAAGALGPLFLDVVAAIVTFYAAARVMRAPREWFYFGRVSKVTWVIGSLWFTWRVGDVVLPLGAVVALWRLRSLHLRHTSPTPGDLPFCAGDKAEPWGRAMTGCDNCHVVAVIGPCSNDISIALEMLGAVPLELTGVNQVWSWSEDTVPRTVCAKTSAPVTQCARGRSASD